MNTRNFFAGAIVVFAIALLLSLMFMPQADVSAAPQAAPTPAASVNLPGVAGGIVTFWDTRVITQDGGSGMQNIANHALVDLHLVLDQGDVNTTTFKLQFSNNGVNWADGAAVGSTLAVDTNTMQQYAIFGRFARIHADVVNTNPLTVTVIGVAK